MLALVLKRRDFRESDQIISFFTKENGKIELLARGVKKIISKNSAHLELFSLISIEIAKGKEVDHLTKVQSVEFFRNIRMDLKKSLMASYIVSLVEKLTYTEEKDLYIFKLLNSWLNFVNKNEDVNWVLVDGFIVLFLRYLGFDILYSDNISNVEIKKDLEILSKGDWQIINNLKFEESEYKRLHNFIYQFLLFQSEKKVADWFNLDLIQT